MARKHLRSPSFLCVTETESMATVCLTQVPTAHHWCVAVTYTRSTSSFGRVEACKYEGRVGWGGCGFEGGGSREG